MALALLYPGLGAKFFDLAEQKFSRLARRPKLAVVVVGLAALAARAAVLPILPAPQPLQADEYSYLLAADTFAHGRLTNPTHPMWIHFETFHVIQTPTYMSMYPPGQGLLLATGLVLAHGAFVGVWLSIGLMCAAICWMLQAWLPPEWALLGGFLAVMRFGVFSYWADSYWGGALAATGGALVVGALPRVVRSERTGDALWMAIGLALLANTRPYEGLIFSLPVAFGLFAWLFKQKGPAFWVSMRRVILPLALAMSIVGLAMGYYNWRVTGNPVLTAQQVDRTTYAVAPYFLWESPRPTPSYHHQEIRDFYLRNELDFYTESRTLPGAASVLIVRYAHFWFFYLGPAFTLPLVLLIAIAPVGSSWSRLGRDTRFLVLAAGVSIAGLTAEVFFYPHYAAPMTCLVLALVLEAMRRVRVWQWRGKPAGRFVTRAVPLVCLLMLAYRAAAPSLHLPITPAWPLLPYNAVPVQASRADIEARLEAFPGNHLVIVRRSPQSKPFGDWVYNDADIDNARIVWARDMGSRENRELIDYFKNRDVWIIERGVNDSQLSRYATPGPSTSVKVQR